MPSQHSRCTVAATTHVSRALLQNAAGFWYNIKLSGELDKRTMHAGCPVLLGSKWGEPATRPRLAIIINNNNNNNSNNSNNNNSNNNNSSSNDDSNENDSNTDSGVCSSRSAAFHCRFSSVCIRLCDSNFAFMHVRSRASPYSSSSVFSPTLSGVDLSDESSPLSPVLCLLARKSFSPHPIPDRIYPTPLWPPSLMHAGSHVARMHVQLYARTRICSYMYACLHIILIGYAHVYKCTYTYVWRIALYCRPCRREA